MQVLGLALLPITAERTEQQRLADARPGSKLDPWSRELTPQSVANDLRTLESLSIENGPENRIPVTHRFLR